MQIKLQSNRFPNGWTTECKADHRITFINHNYPHDIDVSIIKLFRQFGIEVSDMFKSKELILVLELKERLSNNANKEI
jgi:hypothetical protein